MQRIEEPPGWLLAQICTCSLTSANGEM